MAKYGTKGQTHFYFGHYRPLDLFTLYSRKCQKKQKTILLVEYFGSGRRNKEEKCGKAQNFLARFCPGPTLDFLPLYPFDNDIDDNADENRETMKAF